MLAEMRDHSLLKIDGSPERFAADVDRLSSAPQMPKALRSFAAGYIAQFQPNLLLDLVTGDCSQIMMLWMVFYFDAGFDGRDPNTGLTLNRFKAACAQTGMCSPGRASAMLGLLRFARMIEPAHAARRGQPLRLAPTERLRTMFRKRISNVFSAISYLTPEGAFGLSCVGDPVFERAFVSTACNAFLSRPRPVTFGPRAQLFGESKAGIAVLFSLIQQVESQDLASTTPVFLSVSALSKQFSVSRAQIRDLLDRASADGLLTAVSLGDKTGYRISPPLRDDLYRTVAALWVLIACGVRAGLAAIEQDKMAVEHQFA